MPNSTDRSVPLSHPLGRGTAGQSTPEAAPEPDTTRDTQRDIDLKLLAKRVLQRDITRDSQRDMPPPQPPRSVPGLATPVGQSAPPEWLSQVAERVSHIMADGNIPRAWAEGYARLSLMSRPKTYPDRRWREIVDDAGCFLDRWAATAYRLSWPTEDIFGIHPIAPVTRVDALGLVMVLHGREVVDVTETFVEIKCDSGSNLRFYRRPSHIDGHRLLWEIRQLSSAGGS